MEGVRYDIGKVRIAAGVCLIAAIGVSIAFVAGWIGGAAWVASIGVAWGTTVALAIMTLGTRGSTTPDRIMSQMWAWVLLCGVALALLRALPGRIQVGVWSAVVAMLATILLVGHGKVFGLRDQPGGPPRPS